MGFNPRLAPKMAKMTFGSVATDGSSAGALFCPERAGQLLGARFVNSGTASVVSGTTAASALNVYVHKNAMSGSIAASARLGEVATFATATLTLATSTSLQRFSAGDVYVAELVGGAGNDASQAAAIVQIHYMYGWSFPDTTTP